MPAFTNHHILEVQFDIYFDIKNKPSGKINLDKNHNPLPNFNDIQDVLSFETIFLFNILNSTTSKSKNNELYNQ